MIKDRLEKAMKASGCNARELSRRSGLSEASISRYLSGQMEPRANAVSKMATALHVDAVWLMCLDDAPELQLPDSIKNSPDLKKPLVIECYHQLNEDGQLELEHYFKYLLSKQKEEPDSSEAGK